MLLGDLTTVIPYRSLDHFSLFIAFISFTPFTPSTPCTPSGCRIPFTHLILSRSCTIFRCFGSFGYLAPLSLVKEFAVAVPMWAIVEKGKLIIWFDVIFEAEWISCFEMVFATRKDRMSVEVKFICLIRLCFAHYVTHTLYWYRWLRTSHLFTSKIKILEKRVCLILRKWKIRRW